MAWLQLQSTKSLTEPLLLYSQTLVWSSYIDLTIVSGTLPRDNIVCSTQLVAISLTLKAYYHSMLSFPSLHSHIIIPTVTRHTTVQLMWQVVWSVTIIQNVLNILVVMRLNRSWYMHILVIVGQFINVNGSRSSSVHMFVCVCVCVFWRESNHISSLALTVIAHASQQHWSLVLFCMWLSVLVHPKPSR